MESVLQVQKVLHVNSTFYCPDTEAANALLALVKRE